MNEIRIRDSLERETQYVWPNPAVPKAKKPSWEKCEELQKKLDKDRREFFIRAALNGL